MLAGFLLALREGIEAALIISIVLGMLKKMNRPDRARVVWLGVGGAALISVNAGYAGQELGLARSAMQGFGGGAGFTLVLLLVAGIRERLELADMPRHMKGLPIAFITLGLLALAFLGFSGMKL